MTEWPRPMPLTAAEPGRRAAERSDRQIAPTVAGATAEPGHSRYRGRNRSSTTLAPSVTHWPDTGLTPHLGVPSCRGRPVAVVQCDRVALRTTCNAEKAPCEHLRQFELEVRRYTITIPIELACGNLRQPTPVLRYQSTCRVRHDSQSSDRRGSVEIYRRHTGAAANFCWFADPAQALRLKLAAPHTPVDHWPGSATALAVHND